MLQNQVVWKVGRLGTSFEFHRYLAKFSNDNSKRSGESCIREGLPIASFCSTMKLKQMEPQSMVLPSAIDGGPRTSLIEDSDKASKGPANNLLLPATLREKRRQDRPYKLYIYYSHPTVATVSPYRETHGSIFQ